MKSPLFWKIHLTKNGYDIINEYGSLTYGLPHRIQTSDLKYQGSKRGLSKRLAPGFPNSPPVFEVGGPKDPKNVSPYIYIYTCSCNRNLVWTLCFRERSPGGPREKKIEFWALKCMYHGALIKSILCFFLLYFFKGIIFLV